LSIRGHYPPRVGISGLVVLIRRKKNRRPRGRRGLQGGVFLSFFGQGRLLTGREGEKGLSRGGAGFVGGGWATPREPRGAGRLMARRGGGQGRPISTGFCDRAKICFFVNEGKKPKKGGKKGRVLGGLDGIGGKFLFFFFLEPRFAMAPRRQPPRDSGPVRPGRGGAATAKGLFFTGPDRGFFFVFTGENCQKLRGTGAGGGPGGGPGNGGGRHHSTVNSSPVDVGFDLWGAGDRPIKRGPIRGGTPLGRGNFWGTANRGVMQSARIATEKKKNSGGAI